MVKLKKYKKNILFHLILNIVFALFVTCSSYYHVPVNGFKDNMIYFIHLCIAQSTFAGVLYILSLSKVIFKIVFTILFLVYGFIAFWVYSIDISVSSALVNAALTTKSYIIIDLISVQLILFVMLQVGVVLGLLRLYNGIKHRQGIFVFLPVSIGLIFLFFFVNEKRTKSFSSKLPYSLFYSIEEYWNTEDTPLRNMKITTDIGYSEKLKVVLVLGESLRADHLELNGYERSTTPLLSKRQNIVSFNNVFTNKTNTALSVPRILTDQSIHDINQDSIASLFNILNSRKIPTKWIGNQLLEKSYKSIVETNDEVIIIDELRSYWSFNKKQDFHLLPEFKSMIPKYEYGLFSLHMIGSHWWYEDKYTEEFRVFKPVVDSKYIPSLSKEQLFNSYDNTILYLDAFLDKVIKVLEQQKEPTILIYIADHGEAMGEDGKWLHSHYQSLTNPGMIIWYSDNLKEKYPFRIKILENRRDESITTDVIYHSILNLFEIEEYDNQQSIFYCEI